MGFATHLGPWLLGTVKNTTGTTAGTIENLGCTVVAQSAAIAFGTTTAINLASLPAGAQILDIYVDVTTAFNAATGNTITVATAGGTTLATAGSASTTPLAVGRATVTTAAPATWVNVGTTDLIITGVFANTGTAATTGAATITIEYVVRNSDGGQIPTTFQN
jgi:hypothetical protein